MLLYFKKKISELTADNSIYAYDCQNSWSIRVNTKAVSIMNEMGAYLHNPINNPNTFMRPYNWKTVECFDFGSEKVDKWGRLHKTFAFNLPKWFPIPRSYLVIVRK